MSRFKLSNAPCGGWIDTETQTSIPADSPAAGEVEAWIADGNTPDPADPPADPPPPDPVAVAAQAAAVAVAADPSIAPETKVALGSLVAAIVAERGGAP